MARKRMIDPSIWNSEDFSKLSELAKLVFIGLFSQADDKGRGKAKPAYLKSILFPYSEDVKLIKRVENALNEIGNHMSIVFYKIDENEYYQLTNWDVWQKVEKAQESKIPICNDSSDIIRGRIDNSSESVRGIVGEYSGNARRLVSPNKNKNKNKNIIEENKNGRAHTHNIIYKYNFKDIIAICKEESQILFARHQNDINNDYKLAQVTDEISQFYNLEEIRALLKHVNKTYIVQPKYKTLDLVWVLNNWNSAANAEEINNQSLQNIKVSKDTVSAEEAAVWK